MENFFVKKVSTYSTSELQFWRRENDKFYENPQFFILFADFTKKNVLMAARYTENIWRDFINFK